MRLEIIVKNVYLEACQSQRFSYFLRRKEPEMF
jgi:hypothetical protein